VSVLASNRRAVPDNEEEAPSIAHAGCRTRRTADRRTAESVCGA